MANVSVYNMEGKEVGTIELNDAVFGVEINEHLVHMAVVQQLANKRQGTQKVYGQCNTHHSCHTNCHQGISLEIKINLQAVSKHSHPCQQRRDTLKANRLYFVP